MGRELKRVPIDFKWQIGQIWKGYLNPYNSQKCQCCDGSGLNRATNKLNNDWYGWDNPKYINLSENRRYNANAWQYQLTEIEVKALMKSRRISDVSNFRGHFDEEQNTWVQWIDGQKVECDEPEMPTPESVNNWAIHTPMGHDSINRWICVEARAKHLGVYGKCEMCEGEGCIWQSDEIKTLSENWQSFDPPTGEGFQLWSTTTEGHPMTPVFATLDELCEYLELEKVSVFGRDTASKEKWKSMLDENFVRHEVGSMVFI